MIVLPQLPRSIVRNGIDALPVLQRRRVLYRLKHGRWPNIVAPQTFSEKVNWRILFDRRALLSWTCDKLAMKEYASRQSDTVRVPETYWSGENLSDLRNVTLPTRWVLKPNNTSGPVLLGSGVPDYQNLCAQTRGWINDRHAKKEGEWAYSLARRLFLVEEYLGDDTERTPPDYKFFVFGGEVRMIQVDQGRFTRHERRLYTPAWEPLPHHNVYPLGAAEEPPPVLPEMLDLASILGQEFDFIRVDLYSRGSDVFLGEFTPYPGGGLEPYSPDDLDHELGAVWSLPSG